MTPLVPGTYDIYAWWKTASSGGAADAKYYVRYNATKSMQVTVNQTTNDSRWNYLGAFTFASGDDPYVYVSDLATGKVTADAVKFVYRTPNPSYLVDNASATFSGTWSMDTSTAGYVGPNVKTIAKGTGGGWAKWTLPLTQDGVYDLYALWTAGTTRSTKARYDIFPVSGVHRYTVFDQKVNGGVWGYLGRYGLLSANANTVTLSQASDGLIVADAVLAVKTDEPEPLVVDNVVGSWFTTTGTWTTQTAVSGYAGLDYFESTNTAGRSARWLPYLSAPGTYNASALWTSTTTRSRYAPYVVRSYNGPTAVDEYQQQNQRLGSGLWQPLGRYWFPAGQGTVWVEVQSSTDGTTVADAVKLEPTLLPLPDVIDNTDPGFSLVAGTWTSATTLTGYKGPNYLLHTGSSSGAKVRWTPNLAERGYYNVYLWWPAADTTYATNASFTVAHSLGTSTQTVNQQVNGGKWNYLGTFFFNGGSGGYVELSDTATGKVLADAVRFFKERR